LHSLVEFSSTLKARFVDAVTPHHIEPSRFVTGPPSFPVVIAEPDVTSVLCSRAPITLLDHIDTEEKTSTRRVRVRPNRRSSTTPRESPFGTDSDEEPDVSPREEAKILTETAVHAEELVLRLFAFSNLSWSIPEDKSLVPEAPVGHGRHRRPAHGSFDGAIPSMSTIPDVAPSKASATSSPLPAVVEFCEILLSGAEIEV
jgi:hypothetical protein